VRVTWVLIGVAAWVVLAVAGALLIGRAIHLADRRSGRSPNFVVDDTTLPQPRTPPPAEQSPLQTDSPLPRPPC
jgi:hypothetical protein